MTIEIIRNGVKIERCRYSELLYGAVCCNKPGLHEACNDNPECEYKQLKRLEQENEAYKQSEQEATEIVAELKHENEKLKRDYIEMAQASDRLVADAAKMLSQKCDVSILSELSRRRDKYKSALEEIKEIANKFDYWNSNLPEASNVINEIKDKIDEVLK